MTLRPRRSRWWLALIALLILACGALLGWAQAREADRRLRLDLERQAQLLMRGLDMTTVRRLAQAQGRDPVAYERTHRHLASVVAWDPRVRYAYLLQRRDQRLHFLADSDLVESAEYVEEDDPYDDAPPEAHRAFIDGRATVAGPYQDRWGRWVSAFVPVFDPATATPGISTPPMAQEIVRRAIGYLHDHGREALLAAVNDRNGPFCIDDLYVFVARSDGRVLAHPFVDAQRLDLQADPRAHPITVAILDAIAGKQEAWASYRYINPLTGREEDKATFVMRDGDLLICAGAYASSGRVLAVFGIDIDAAELQRQAWSAALAPLATTAALLAALGLLAALRRPLERRARGLLPALAVVCVALAVTALAAHIMRATEQHRQDEQAQRLAEERLRAVLADLRQACDHTLDALSGLVRTQPALDRAAFERYVLSVAGRWPVVAWAWVEVDPASPDGAPRWRERAYLALAGPSGAVPLALDDPAQQLALKEACDSGEIATALDARRDLAHPSHALWVWKAVRWNGTRQEAVGVCMRFDAIVRSLGESLPQLTALWQVWPDGSRLRLAGAVSQSEAATLALPIALGDRTLVAVTAAQLAQGQERGMSAWLITVILGGIISFGAGFLAWRVAREQDRLEQEVEARTRTLAEREAEQRRAAERSRAAADILGALIADPAWAEGDIPALARRATELVARRLGIARVGIWLFAEDGQRLVSEDSYDLARDEHRRGEVLTSEQYGPEFAWLQHERFVDAHDAWHDPRTAAFADGYLRPLGITSMLDAGIRTESGCLGSVCFEHIGPMRRWSDEEIAFACQLADQFALAIANRRRRQVEQALTIQERRMREILAAIDAGVLLVAGDRLEFSNPCAARLLGDPPAPERLAELLAGPALQERCWAQADGSTLTVLAALRELPGAEHAQRLITLVDISDRKAMEQRLADLNRELELAAAQASDLAARAEAASAAKGAFLASMSHEIRTPLHGILGMCEVLIATALDDEQRDMVRTVQRSAEALLALLNDILDYSKVEAGKLAIERLPCDLRQLAQEVADLFRARASSQVDLWVRCTPALPERVLGDPLRLRQILTNLVGNALKFTAEGHVLVELDWHAGWLQLAVHDTGRGIPESVLPTLFQPFQQADASVSRTHGGSGLGLAICKRLCEAMGGSIGVQSRVGVGSSFTVRLPLAPAPDAAAPPAAPLAGLRLLVIDDRPACGQILADILADLGAMAAPLEAGADDAAWREACAERPAAAVVDLHGSEEDMAAALGRVRERLPELPLIALAPVRERRMRAQLAGAAIVGKPLRIVELVEALLGRHPVSAADAADAMRPPTPACAGCRVLVVDDEPINRQVAQSLLARLGCRVACAADGDAALALLEREVFDVVLLDCRMPGRDGYAVARAWREREALSGRGRTPILALTAHAVAEEHQRCREAGMDAVLTKPISGQQLAEALRQWWHPPSAPPAGHAPRAADGGEPVFAPDNLALIAEGDPALARQLMDDALAHLARARQEWPALLAAADLATLAAAVHRLGGAIGNLGGRELAARCRALERAARQGDGDACRDAWEAWRAAAERFETALTTYRAGLPATDGA